MKKAWLLLVSAPLLTGCDFIDSWLTDPAIRACEISVKRQLRAPATYVRSDASIYGRSVSLVFDSQNGFGALIRDTATCNFGQVKLDDAGEKPDDGFQLLDMTVAGQRSDPVVVAAANVLLVKDGLFAIPPSKTALASR